MLFGGTGLYVDSLVYEIQYPKIEFDENYRNKLEEKVVENGLQELYEQAKEIDPQAMEKISPNDRKRILRVLEIYHATGKTKTKWDQLSRKEETDYEYIVFAIDLPREMLYERINNRVEDMIKNGLIEEVRQLIQMYDHFPTAMQGLGYKEVVEYLQEKTTKEEMIDKIKKETRHYAKRQLTWFRKNKQTIWLNGQEKIQNNVALILEGIKIGRKEKNK